MAEHSGRSERHDRALLGGVSRRQMEEYVSARLEALGLGGGSTVAAGASATAGAAPRPAPSGLQEAYDELYQKHEALLAERARDAASVSSLVSDEAVDAFVEKLLADPGVNMRFVPDSLEGTVYRNVLKMVLHSFAHASDAAGIELLGHRIRIVIQPAAL